MCVEPAGRLGGKNCLIIGGTTGIGLASAVRFQREGANLVVTGLTDRLDPSAGLAGVPILALEVRAVAAIDRVFESARELLGGRIDVVLHVAGISGRKAGDGALHECSDEGWAAVLETNARGVFASNRAAVRMMRAQALDDFGLRGTVVNVGSVLARSPSAGHFGTVAYAASKGAVEALTLAAAAAYAPERIRFNVLAPGVIDTPMAARAVADDQIRAYLATKQPMAAGPGTAEDCAEAALFLCEPRTRFITGVVLYVDGGWRISEGSTR